MLTRRCAGLRPACTIGAAARAAGCPEGREGLAASSLSAVMRLLAACCSVPAPLFLDGPGGTLLCPTEPFTDVKTVQQLCRHRRTQDSGRINSVNSSNRTGAGVLWDWEWAGEWMRCQTHYHECAADRDVTWMSARVGTCWLS